MDFWLHLIIAYVLVCTVVYYILAPFMMYVPPKGTYKDNAQIIKLTTADGTVISAMYLQHKTAEYTILFSHGNAEDLGTLYPVLEQFLAHGFSVLAYDYHGYGTSKGF